MIKPKLSILPILTLVIGYYPLIKTIGFHSSDAQENDLKILSYNIGYTRFLFNDKTNSRKHIEAFKTFLKKEDPDIICLQERAKWQEDIYKEIFKNYHFHPNTFIGTAVLSKRPIEAKGNIAFDTKAHNATWIDIIYNKNPIRIYSVHLSSNKVKNLTDDNFREIWDKSTFILDKYNEHAVIRAQQLEQILDHAEKVTTPVIITGDFNDIPQSYNYRQISSAYCDAFIEAGTGMGKTFRSKIPGLRIDYAFTNEKLNVTNHYIPKIHLSDHYPIITQVRLKS